MLSQLQPQEALTEEVAGAFLRVAEFGAEPFDSDDTGGVELAPAEIYQGHPTGDDAHRSEAGQPYPWVPVRSFLR
ncbi:hypothetical protein TPA0908_58530 [Micromonospora sp. AKA38]|nr:hypothetical protein TPA0908_58530 [Micromonospora sp. AKA38]